ncbi:10503_t:CDS:1, partial [Acaulospora morrowiae]
MSTNAENSMRGPDYVELKPYPKNKKRYIEENLAKEILQLL